MSQNVHSSEGFPEHLGSAGHCARGGYSVVNRPDTNQLFSGAIMVKSESEDSVLSLHTALGKHRGTRQKCTRFPRSH